MSSLTIPHSQTSPKQDAIRIHKAVTGFGCDDLVIIDILAHRDFNQRALILQEYKAMYSEDLAKRLQSELTRHLKRSVLLWILEPAERDATIIRDALLELVDREAPIEVICSRTPSEIQAIKAKYIMKFGRDLDDDIGAYFVGDAKRLLLLRLNSIDHHEGQEIDHGLVASDTMNLYRAGEDRLGTNENAFITIFGTKSRTHLAHVASHYCNTYATTLEQAVKSETSLEFKFALLSVLRCALNPPLYFAKRLRKSMKGIGTSDRMLIRLVVSRAEIDMQYVKGEYQKKYNKSLRYSTQSETSGHYREFLLALVGSD